MRRLSAWATVLASLPADIPPLEPSGTSEREAGECGCIVGRKSQSHERINGSEEAPASVPPRARSIDAQRAVSVK